METAMTNEENSPTRGSTPAMIENEIASGMRARATTRPARTSRLRRRGLRRACNTVGLLEGLGRFVVGTGDVIAIHGSVLVRATRPL